MELLRFNQVLKTIGFVAQFGPAYITHREVLELLNLQIGDENDEAELKQFFADNAANKNYIRQIDWQKHQLTFPTAVDMSRQKFCVISVQHGTVDWVRHGTYQKHSARTKLGETPLSWYFNLCEEDGRVCTIEYRPSQDILLWAPDLETDQGEK